MRTFVVRLLAIFSVTTACASGASAPPDTPNQSAPAASTGPSSSAEPASGTDPKPTMESQHQPFVEGCMQKAHSAEYCECGFQQFAEIFKDADLNQKLEQGDARLKALQEKTVSACGSKLSEAQVKASYLEGCIAKDDRKSAYCNCSFTAMRKHLEVTDFLGDGEQPRFVEAKKKMVVACKGKLPVEIPQADFMSGCTKGDTNRDKPCTCLWKKIKAKYSSEEIAAGTVDVTTVPGLADCNK